MNISDSFSNQESAIVDEVMEITTPFKQVQLDWTSADGMQTGTVSLNNRMKKLQNTLDAEQQELISQWEEWVESENEINELVDEFAMLTNEDGDADGNVHWDLNDLLAADYNEMVQEIEAERAYLKQMIDEATEASLKAMEEGEKVHIFLFQFHCVLLADQSFFLFQKSNIQQQKAEQQFMALLREID